MDVWPCIPSPSSPSWPQSSAKRANGGRRNVRPPRSFFAGAVDSTPDKQGRVAIPQSMREYAHLEREVTVVGSFDHIEIWDARTFAERDAIGVAAIAQGEGFNDFL